VAGAPGDIVEDFVVPPTLAGMATLSKRLAAYPGVVAVAEPTSMTWLPLAIALGDAGGRLALVGLRHAARLRSALAGKNKSDPIDAGVLSRAAEFFELEPARIPDAAELALRRAAQRRGKAIVDANRALRRLVSLARWAFPDVWNACAGSRSTALAVIRRWPHLDGLRRARVGSIAEVVAAHTRGVVDAETRAERIRSAASEWRDFWHGHLDLDGLAWETAELLDDLAIADARVDRATEAARSRWEALWGDDPLLLSVPGMGPITAPTVRAFLADGTHLSGAKEAQAFVGLNPSNWSSGTMESPSRAITKEGPPVLRFAFYQAANVARTVDPPLAGF
jgi:transposase